MRRPLLTLLLLLAGAPAAAQRVHEVPPRPTLYAEADTNSAMSYYLHGTQNLQRDPRTAAAAFYWAERLNPGWPDALYGRRVALLMTDNRRLVGYMLGERSVLRNREVQAIDSLYLRALLAEPFLIHKLDRRMFETFVIAAFSEGTSNTALAAFEARNWLSQASPAMKAWFAFSEGRFGEALGEYERALRRARRDERPRMRTDVARIQFFMGSHDQAVENFGTALQEFRDRDERDLVFVYESKALLEHSVGAIHEQRGNVAAAREAYGRALQEDLTYAPAHLRLATLAQAAGDTETAISEMALTVELAPNDASIRYRNGVVLAAAGRALEGAAELERAIAMEPYYAAPHLPLGMLHAGSGRHDEAITHLEAFLRKADRQNPQRSTAERLLTTSRAARAGQ